MKDFSEDCCSCEATDNYFQALQDTVYVIGGKWRLQVLYSIYMGNRRFREIERSIAGITTRMLSKELKTMEVNKLITRTVYPTTPVTIEYTATEYSTSLIKVVETMIEWGLEHREKIKA
jgi:DNA-binding HxlR family transcriptional regulator